MNSKFDVKDFLSPLEHAKQTLEVLNDLYKDDMFSNMEDAKKLIESYEKLIRILRYEEEVAENY